MAQFFIDRPIFAWVIAILIMLAGVISINTLPVAQYPNIAPPTVSITAIYPGASARAVEDSVTQVIEQQMKALDGLDYMYSTSDSMGLVTITLVFFNNTDADIAQVQVQNKLQLATPFLPEAVQKQGITVSKASNNYLLVPAFISSDGSMSDEDISDYVSSSIMDPISRVQGVGDMTLFGAQYAMRIWCNPSLFEKYALTPADVVNAIKTQNNEVSAGQIGGAPAVEGMTVNYTINSQSRLETKEQFEDIILRVGTDGSIVYLRDVARIELGGENYNSFARFNGKPASGLGIKLASGANALDTVDRIKAKIAELEEFYPNGMATEYAYDTTPFVRISIHEVVKTLFEAIFLVFCLMFLFLQNFRATLIPTIAVPVVLLGTFGVMAAAGFSVNTLTMFGMVLAIGLLVDDAIVVVENVERVMAEEKLPPKEATSKSMKQITGALVGIAMVLSAVFVPMAFFGGSAGVIYRQFSITIVSAMGLSVLIALVLTPALCATMLKDHNAHEEKAPKKGLALLLANLLAPLRAVTAATDRFFSKFNIGFEKATEKYKGGVHNVIKRPVPFLLLYLGIIGLLAVMFLRLPTGFLPDEDQGILMMTFQLPAGASYDRTDRVMAQIEEYMQSEEGGKGVKSFMVIGGSSFSGNGQNNGMGFIGLKDWEERDGEEMRAQAIAGRMTEALSSITDAQIFVFAPPAVIELGTASGFDFELMDNTNQGHDALMTARNMLLAATQTPEAQKVLRLVRPNGLEDTDQYRINIDMAKAGAQSINLSEINNTITAFWGSAYTNDFKDRGRIKKVYIQADAPYRTQAEDLNLITVRNTKGEMVPFSSIASGTWEKGSPRLERFNGVSSMEILGEAAPGHSTGEAMAKMEELTRNLEKDLGPGFGFEWTGLSRQERASGGQAPALYTISMLIVFLCLAALYESWSIPVAVLLVVPLGIIGSVAASFMRGLYNDVYFQVGLLTIVGLSAKNAILIVEFAKALHEEGKDIFTAAVEASRLRLRPIIMTSMAFILGVLPLAVSTGAGSGSQNDIGTGVIGGMISATLLGIFFIPLFFVVVSNLFKGKKKDVHAGASGAE